MIGLATGDKLARLLVTIVNAQSRKRMDLAGKCCCFCFMYVTAGFRKRRSWSRSRKRTCKSARDLAKNKNVSRNWRRRSRKNQNVSFFFRLQLWLCRLRCSEIQVGVESRSGRIDQSQCFFPTFCAWFSYSASVCDLENVVFTRLLTTE